MEKSSVPGYFDDVWMQIFILLAVVSGLFSVRYASYALRRAGAARLLAAPAKIARTSPGAAKLPGQWVVDPQMGPDADGATVADVLAKAADGDTVILRPGTYNEAVRPSKSVTLKGAGISPEEVVLTHAGAQTVDVERGSVVLENLTVANTGSQSDWVVNLFGASLALKNVRLRSGGRGIRVDHATLGVSDSTLEAREAVQVKCRTACQSRVQILSTTIAALDSGVAAAGEGIDVRIENSDLRSGRGSAVEASQKAFVRMKGVTLSHGAAAAVAARSGAVVQVSDSTLAENGGCGATLDGRATLYLEKDVVARERCGVGFLGPGTLEVRNSEFSELSLGALAIKPGVGLEKDVVIRESGNVGFSVPGGSGETGRLP